jgi:hypothetical protein
MRAGAAVADPAWPPVLFSDNLMRIGRPIYWRDGKGTTLQAFRDDIESGLAGLF